MSTNYCLKTVLKESVDNDNLPLFGYVKVEVSNGQNEGVTIKSLKAGDKVKLTNGLRFVNANTDEIVSDGVNIIRDYVSSGSGFLLIPKYNLSSFDLQWGNIDVDSIRFKFNIDELIEYNQNDFSKFLITGATVSSSKDAYNISGDIGKASTKVTQELNVSRSHVYGNVAEVVDKSNIQLLKIERSDCVLAVLDLEGANSLVTLGINDNTTGLFDDLGRLSSLNTLSYGHNKGGTVRSSLTGSVTNFVTNAIASRISAGGDGSGSLSIYAPKVNFPNVTWPANTPTEIVQTTMSWDAQGNITFA